VRFFLRLFINFSKRHMPLTNRVSLLRLFIIFIKRSTVLFYGVHFLLRLLKTLPSIQNRRILEACAGDCPVFSKKAALSRKCLRFWNHQKHITMDAMAVGEVEKLQRKLCMAGRGTFVMNITWPVAVLKVCKRMKRGFKNHSKYRL